MPFDDFYKKLEVLSDFDIEAETIDIINKNGYYIEGLIRLQLQEGKDGRDENVKVFGRDYYSDRTIQDKRYNGIGLGKQTEWITNYMTGAFYSSLRTITEGETFETISPLDYFQDILNRSGSVIMELNEKHLKEFSEEILFPELQKRFNSRFNGV